jgi:hypothetical protein
MSNERQDSDTMSRETTPRSTADLAYGRSSDTVDDTRPEAPDGGRVRSNDTEDERTPLLRPDRTSSYSERWQEVQAKFVDEPQDAVQQADGLVAEVIQELATTFADQRKGLEDQWSRGTEVSTEDLRQALMQYRSFFQRLMAA